MRELTSTETDHAAGGIAISTTIAIGIGTSIGGAYVYEKLGGAEGIDRIVKTAWNAAVRALTARATLCQVVPDACTPEGIQY